jgi:hypothetical protein
MDNVRFASNYDYFQIEKQQQQKKKTNKQS